MRMLPKKKKKKIINKMKNKKIYIFLINLTCNGKKSPGIDDAQLNSNDPALFDASIIGKFHCKQCLRES